VSLTAFPDLPKVYSGRPLRIGLIAPPWVAIPPPAYGGTEAVLDVLARGLALAGHEIVLFTTGDSTCPVPRASVYESAVGIAAGGPVAEAHHVVTAYQRLADMDIIHDHTIVGPLWASGTASIPVVATNHGPFDPALTSIFRAAGQRLAVVAISHHQASTAPTVPIAAVIHHGLDVAAIPQGDGQGGYAAFVGRMSPDKGLQVAIQAARAAGVRLRIATKMREPAEHAYFDQVVRPLLGPDLELLGEVSPDEKWALVGGAMCLLNPIQWPEPFGMVMIEALACGTPVVSTPFGAAPEIVEPGLTGALARDTEGLAAGIRAASGLDRQTCRESVEIRFSMERMVADHLSLYRRLLGLGTAVEASAAVGTSRL
jgi:glycosyltransferase involved in cell wall biosynthesis